MSSVLDLSDATKILPNPCPNCPLRSLYRVGARGNIRAPIVIIGEAPGGLELKQGLPFIGPSGSILEQCFPVEFQVDKEALIINAMQCCPPRTSSQTKDKQIKSLCVATCRGAIQQTVWAHPRKVLLILGNWAAFHLLGDISFKITQNRGTVDAVIDPVRGTEVPVVYAMHPASLLHGRGSPIIFKQDVQLALEKGLGSVAMYGEGIRTTRQEYIEPTYIAMETPEQVGKLIEKFKQYPNIDASADLETHTFSPWTGHILCASLYGGWDDNVAHIIPWRNMQDPLYAEAVNDLFGQDVRWIWQNGMFDRRWLKKDPRVKVIPKIADDTLLLSYALDEASKAHDLEEQAKNLLGAPNYKDALKQWVPTRKDSYINVPEPNLWDYAAKDGKNTWAIAQITRARVAEDKHLQKLYTQTLLPASPVLADISTYGIMTDANLVTENRTGLEQDIQGTLLELASIAGRPINPNSPPEVSAYLYDQLGLTIKGRRPKDTRKETLDKLIGDAGFAHPAVKLIRQYRRLVKLLSTYVVAIEVMGVDGIIHTSYKLHITTTGRLSSSEPNIQNIPREARLRRMYCARPGYVLLEGDYNTAELRMLAVASRDAFLTAIFLDGKRNLHDEVSIQMYGPDFTPDQRIRAKAINFGIPYGREAFSIAEEFSIRNREAQRLIDSWFETAPGARDFIAKCRMAPTRNQSLITVFGRKRRPGLVSRERLGGLQNEFANFIMQSTVSDFTLHAAMELEQPLQSVDSHVVNLVHDSLILEVPDNPEAIQTAGRMLKHTMEAVPQKHVDTPIRFIVDMKIGTHWGLLKHFELAN